MKWIYVIVEKDSHEISWLYIMQHFTSIVHFFTIISYLKNVNFERNNILSSIRESFSMLLKLHITFKHYGIKHILNSSNRRSCLEKTSRWIFIASFLDYVESQRGLRQHWFHLLISRQYTDNTSFPYWCCHSMFIWPYLYW